MLTVTGFGFGENAAVTVGGDECAVVDASYTELRCRTPPVRIPAVYSGDTLSH